MADNTNPQNSGTIDLRNAGAGGGTSGQTGAGLPQADKFEIPESVKKQYPDLIVLILKTESMNDDERQYWFQILPIMTDEQVNKLRDILKNEAEQLITIDKEYEQEMKRINVSHKEEWDAFAAQSKREKVRTAEAKSEEQEKTSEEELLKRLNEN